MADELELQDPSGGPQFEPGAPRSFSRRILRIAVPLVVLAAAAIGINILATHLPGGTQTPGLVARGAIGFGIGMVIIVVVRRMLRALTEPPPPPPPVVDVRSAEVVYQCPVCGTRVRLEHAATAKAPKHCGEEMEATIG